MAHNNRPCGVHTIQPLSAYDYMLMREPQCVHNATQPQSICPLSANNSVIIRELECCNANTPCDLRVAKEAANSSALDVDPQAEPTPAELRRQPEHPSPSPSQN